MTAASIADVILLVIVVLIVAVAVFSLRSSVWLIRVFRDAKLPDDRLARAMSRYLLVVAASAVYLAVLAVIKLISQETPEWTTPITALVILLMLTGPTYIEWSCRNARP